MSKYKKEEVNNNGIQLKKIEKNKAACWCCEASTAIDVRQMIEALKKESWKTKK